VIVVGLVAVSAGADIEDPPPAVTIIGTLIQDLLFVAAALGFASLTLRPRAWHFGLRATRFWPALGWAALGFVVFFVFSVFYSAALGLDEEQTTLDDLGADESTLALVAGGLLVIVIAPIVEEFFFRGFLYRAFRTSLPVWLAAPIGGVVFGVIHFPSGIEAVPSLTVLGIVFCLVYERTGSLYPVIALHAFNNMLAYLIGTEAVALSLALGFGTIAACVVAPRVAWRRAPALP
jgi:membrane protease YdiL (CAAX protease family)